MSIGGRGRYKGNLALDPWDRLLIAIYAGPVVDLVKAYRNGEDAQNLESWIKLDVYGALDDPDRVIRMCREMSGDGGWLSKLSISGILPR